MTKEKVPKFGTVVTVSMKCTITEKNGKQQTTTKTIQVTVNDRGPFKRGKDHKPLRPLEPDPDTVIDLTPAAFKTLVGDLSTGRVHVTVTVP